MEIRGNFFTSIDQSKHLFDLGLNPETADMCWGIDDNTLTYNTNPYPLPWKDYTAKEFYLPCWSLGALMDVMPSGCNLSTPKPMNALLYCCWNQDTEFYGSTSISAAIAMINWLIENNKMCEESSAKGEQKTNDKIEPKFKVGDKIKLAKEPKYPAREIIAIKNDAYYFDMLVHLPFSHQDEWELVGQKPTDWLEKRVDQKLLNNDKYQTVSVEILDRLYESEKELERLKQGEQKPTDKIEPKFKVGDWIANGKFTWYIKEFKNNLYRLISSDGTEVCDTISFVKRNFHLWTIQDAKDGDVLVFDNSFILIFKEIVDLNTPLLKNIKCFQFKSYINLDFLMNVFEQGNFYDDNGNKCYPATKEQRDLLFQKMKEAGYEWDADKKELKKIEQNPTEDNCKISDCDTKVDMTEYNNGYECGKQRVLKYPEDFNLCKKSAWKPCDEQMEVLYKYAEQNNYDGSVLTSLYRDLKKLKGE